MPMIGKIRITENETNGRHLLYLLHKEKLFKLGISKFNSNVLEHGITSMSNVLERRHHFSHIPNLDHGALEPAVREQEIDGESLLLLTQVSQMGGRKPASQMFLIR